MNVTKRGPGRPAKEFVPMEKTRALLSELWGHWRETLNHTPDKARRVLTAAIKELHKDEVKAIKKAKAETKKVKAATKKLTKKATKTVAKTAVKKVAKKVAAKATDKAATAVKRKIKHA